jgi:isoleucyl-tRNA synthetase
MDRLFMDLNRVSGKDTSASVHLADFPIADRGTINTELEQRMALAQNISSLIHSLRKKHTIKVRQPLSRVLIPILNAKQASQIKAVEDLILSEVNIKAIEYIDDTSGVVVKKIKPNFKKLGKEYGPRMKDVAAIIQGFGQEEIKEIEKQGYKEVELAGSPIRLTPEDVEITSEDIPGWIVASEGGVTVALDITISDELRKEGIARDLVNRVQNMRKDMGLEVQDKIRISVQRADEMIEAALADNREYICTETQALELNLLEQVEGAQQVDMDDYSLLVRIENTRA